MRKESKKELKNESIGALWINNGKNTIYLSGQIEIDGKKHNIVVFKNNYKKEDKHPDYKIYLKKEKSEDNEDLPF